MTVTDANVLLGRIPIDYFPSVFGPDAELPLDRDAVRSKFEILASDISKDSGVSADPETVAAGFLTVAVENMANAIRKITIESPAYTPGLHGYTSSSTPIEVLTAAWIRVQTVFPLRCPPLTESLFA